MSEKTKGYSVVTPAGPLFFPRLNEPDTQYKAEGVYSARIVLDPDQAKPILALIDKAKKDAAELFKEAKGAKAKVVWQEMPVKPETTKEGEETGNLLFNFKMTASGVSKKTGKPWTMRPGLFDAKLNALNPKAVKIGGGTVARVSGTIDPFYHGGKAGVTLRLEAVQVLELKSWGEKTADQYGFGEEDGYDGSEDNGRFSEGEESQDVSGSEEGLPGETDF